MFIAMDKNQAIRQIEEIGLSANSAQVYLDLIQFGISTVLEISKRLDLSRATIYRALEELISERLVHIDEQNNSKYSANDYHQLSDLVKEQEYKIERMQSKLPDLMGYLLNAGGVKSKSSSIKYYEGSKGLEQVQLNTLNAKSIFKTYEIGYMTEYVSMEFAENMRRELVKRKLISQQISNMRVLQDFTKVEGYVGKYWNARYVDKRKLPINVELAVYNDVVLIYDYLAQPFCVEITNIGLAQMQRAIFDFVWKSSRRFKYNGQFGTGTLI